VDEGGEVRVTSIPTGDHALVLIQLGEQALDSPAAPVTPQHASILTGSSSAVTPMRCGQANAVGCEALIERITVTGTLPNKSSGSS
jgi:hypothetical protein